MKKLVKKVSRKYGKIQAFCKGCYCGEVTGKPGNPIHYLLNK